MTYGKIQDAWKSSVKIRFKHLKELGSNCEKLHKEYLNMGQLDFARSSLYIQWIRHKLCMRSQYSEHSCYEIKAYKRTQGKQNKLKLKSWFLYFHKWIHEADPPVMASSDHYFHTYCPFVIPSVRTYIRPSPLFETKQFSRENGDRYCWD